MIDSLDLALERIGAATGVMRLATSTMLPSGALVTVTVQPQPNGAFFVSDEGAGRNDLLALGQFTSASGDTQRGKTIAERYGLSFEDGGFFARDVGAHQLAAVIAFIAEAARNWASRTAEKAQRRLEAAIVDQVERRLHDIHPGLGFDRERELSGASGKRHRFDLAAHLGNDRWAVFEVVNPSTHALSSSYMKLDDLRQSEPDWPREVVTRDIQAWSSADMNLLSRTARVRDLSQDWSDLRVTLQ